MSRSTNDNGIAPTHVMSGEPHSTPTAPQKTPTITQAVAIGFAALFAKFRDERPKKRRGG
jgi:hypothetical protein